VKLVQILVKLKYKLPDGQKIKINAGKERDPLLLWDHKKMCLNFGQSIIW
jgi:hypothetical protein